ncbi:GNAT family N-acetyltransferase [Paenibacillus thermoaerophilus]|uniref:GNAT family N-acetyltransferase n=1 Tax=Paenibacillus thermoaerophilus TaxID=1215385 RepID=A0ABW2V401_9BACL|nr:GNAT family N-acetyltransferase [Paenibacillus thermoaerophilus]TMV17104.1 GNAT family N-acetyltransferase [Paenibacillus thermoaerophilus]
MEVQRVTTDRQLEEAYKIREKVFVEEQGVPPDKERDEHDAYSEHVLAYAEGKPVGTGRTRMVGDSAKLERVCILEAYRKHGIGKAIILELERIAREKGAVKAKLHGQTHAEAFYRKLGYETKSPVFLEEGIPHVRMEKPL